MEEWGWGRRVLFALLLVVGAVVMKTWFKDNPLIPPRTAEQTYQDLEQEFSEGLAREDAGGGFAALRRDFPEDFDRLRTAVVLAGTQAEGDANLAMKRASAMTLAKFRYAHLYDASRAPDHALAQVAAARLKMFRALRQGNVERCASMAKGVRDGDGQRPLDGPALEAVGGLLAASVHAMRQGIDTPTPRKAAAEADFAAVVKAMRARGVDEAMIDSLGSPEAFSQRSVHAQCDAVLLYAEALVTLPEDVQARVVTADLAGEPPPPS